MSKKDSQDSASSCTYTFADGRKCRMLRYRSTKFCLHHARAMRCLRERDAAAEHVSELMENPLVCGTSVNYSLARLFSSIAEGNIPPKTAAQLISLAKVMVKTVPMATREYLIAFDGGTSFDRMVRQIYGYKEPAEPVSSPAPPAKHEPQTKESKLPEAKEQFAEDLLLRIAAD